MAAQQATLKKDKKDESFLDKIGTIARKKKVKEGMSSYECTRPIFTDIIGCKCAKLRLKNVGGAG